MSSVAVRSRSRGLLARPSHPKGIWDWLTTIDHKKIGILYGVTAFIFFLVGGLEALLIRLQLAKPGATVLSADAYNQIFTMHGLTMIFLVVMPLSAAFINYMVPLQIGARDVAFPRMNAFSYWVFLFGGLFLYSSFLLGGGPDSGWFAYAPVTGSKFSGGHRMDFYALGLIITGISSTVSAVNLLVTIINLRAPGMSLMRMPIFTWMSLVVQFLLVFALPIITVDLFLLFFDRRLGTLFFETAANADPLLWQHLFWLFGHPEVYILVLPAMGIVSEILPVFSRKPLFGYPFVVFAGAAIGFMGWGVWAHHMFATGMGPVANSAFAISTMFIAVPTGVKIFNWLATIWKGQLRFTVPMLFSLAFVMQFVVGGLSGVSHALVPHDYQQTDTYYIVAHFHYVLMGGAIFGLFAGLYYWWPKITGRFLNERAGKVQFWLMALGFNLTFAPFHILGLQGMPRRIYTYADGYGWNVWNLVSTAGSLLLAVSVLAFIFTVFISRKGKGAKAGGDPWDARTIEWTTPSPPPEYNFVEIPEVHALDDFWHRKYVENPEGRPVPVPAGAQASSEPHGTAEELGIHMPSPSYMPLLAAFGFPMIGYGVIYKPWWAIPGAIVLIIGLFGWAMEPATEDSHG
ncbi:MAG TPA: cytochrome c oxidase subunit I [Actinomycetota bacterium]